MTDELLVLVDENDKPIGLEEKVKCHLPQGKLHRAFTALIFDENGRLALTKRSEQKMLWPGDWDGTFASHPRENETYESSAERRMPEEIGNFCKMDYLFKFEYHVPYKNIGSENEICGTLLGIVKSTHQFNFVKDEISEIRWVSPSALSKELEKNPKIFCPWMLIALYLLSKSKKEMLQKHQVILSEWIKTDMQKSLENSISFHLTNDKWRLVN